ncbi:MAG: transcriptional repressor [Acidobacteria bacterium]|nr:transcriptional repressor [Acidobacteriota bacterium]
MDVSVTVDHIVSVVRAHGKRVTQPKRAVAQVLSENSSHLTAEEISLRVDTHLEDVSPSTVYRILEEFEELGLCEHTHTGHGAAVYHLVGGGHAHVTCNVCGGTWQVPTEFFEDLTTTLRERLGFELHPHHVALAGTCAACLAQNS